MEILLHFNSTFSQCSVSIYQAFDGQIEVFLGISFCSFVLGYFILQLCSTREVHENLVHTKTVLLYIQSRFFQ